MTPRLAAATALATVLAVLLLGAASCSPKPDSSRIVATWPRADSERVVPGVSAEATATDDALPPADLSASAVDAAGRRPEEAVLQLIEALNEEDWPSAYLMYATPEQDAKTFAKERTEAGEVYVDFTIVEARVTDSDTAAVRVTYTIPAEGEGKGIVIADPGEWWGLSMVEGEWKVNWLPRQ